MVRVVRRISILLLGNRDNFAIYCWRCGGDPERSLNQGTASEFTAAGCTTKDMVDVEGFSWVFRERAAAKRSRWNLGLLSWAGTAEAKSAQADLNEGLANDMLKLRSPKPAL